MNGKSLSKANFAAIAVLPDETEPSNNIDNNGVRLEFFVCNNNL